VDVPLPELGERVLVVPQGWSHLCNAQDPGNVLGEPPDAVSETLQPGYGFPWWAVYDQALVVSLGYGLMLVREGKLVRGPTNWDSGD
jgi:hypothetical protein